MAMQSYVDERLQYAKSLVGKRIEIPVHYNMWMRGARFGTVTSVGKDGAFIRVRMEHAQVRNKLKVWRIDYDFIKVM
ncbi:hypothetical protein [Rhizobium phage RHph_X3_9]|nr:hypothetical protein [Rhizobium phage RHph_X3_9]